MKKRILRILLILLILPLILLGIFLTYNYIQEKIEAKKRAEWVKTLEHTASPQVHILPDTMTVDYLGEKRTLALYLPADYETDSVDYPVIYFLDGQSLFDQKVNEGSEWKVDEVLDSLTSLGQQQAIVVGIYNSDDRLKEYKPFSSDRWYALGKVSGDKHADWIVRVVKPWVDAHFRTQPEPESSVIAGASLGGLMSYYMLMEYPEVFGRAIVFSPSYWVHESVYTLHENNPQFKQQKIYFNAGELETPTVESIEKMATILKEAGMPADHIKLDVEAELGHWHMTWERGFPKAYPWILK